MLIHQPSYLRYRTISSWLLSITTSLLSTKCKHLTIASYHFRVIVLVIFGVLHSNFLGPMQTLWGQFLQSHCDTNFQKYSHFVHTYRCSFPNYGLCGCINVSVLTQPYQYVMGPKVLKITIWLLNSFMSHNKSRLSYLSPILFLDDPFSTNHFLNNNWLTHHLQQAHIQVSSLMITRLSCLKHHPNVDLLSVQQQLKLELTCRRE